VEASVHDEAGKIEDASSAIEDDGIGGGNRPAERFQGIVSRVLKRNYGRDIDLGQPVSNFLCHKPRVRDGGVEERRNPPRGNRTECSDNGVDCFVGHGGPPETAMRRGGVSRDIVIGKKKRKPPEKALDSNEHIVPVDSQCLPLHRLCNNEFPFAWDCHLLWNHSAKKGIAFDARESILIAYELERSFFRVPFLTEVSVVSKGKQKNFH